MSTAGERIASDLGADNGKGPGAADLLRRWTMTELLDEEDTFAWLAKGLLVDPTYGQLGGDLKTLKSVVNTFMTVGIASGRPIFGHFDVGEARPVVAYVGEGGRKPYTRRLRRVARAMGVDLDELALFPIFQVAPVGSDIFRESLARDLREIAPGLVSLDPWYVYHGTATRAADLHQEGALLAGISRPCIDAGASLMIVNHFNQTGVGMNLKRITMAGSGEWADSWVLLAHRVDPDVERGVFKLQMDVGSRQWGGTSWELDLTLGRFDPDLGEHEGEIAWEIRRHGAGDQSAERIVAFVALHPYQLTREEIAQGVGGNRQAAREQIDRLASDGRLRRLHGIRQTADGKSRKTWLYGPKPDDVSTSGGRTSTAQNMSDLSPDAPLS